MKNYLTILFLGYGFLSLAQVGVNTKNPQTKFHVDGKSSTSTTNPTTGAPTPAQQVDDFVVTKDGNVGTGIINPTTKLDINNGSSNGAIQIVDGTQGEGRVLTSNESGVGTWVLPHAMTPVRTGVFEAGQTVKSDNSGGWKYSRVSIVLTKGLWMVNLGLTLQGFRERGNGDWVHMKLSSSNTNQDARTGWENVGPALNNTNYAGLVLASAVYNRSASPNTVYFDSDGNNFISGSNLINVTADTVTLYLMIENKGGDVPPSPLVHIFGHSAELDAEVANAGKAWVFQTGNWENYLYANPL